MDLFQYNDTKREYDESKTIQELIEEQTKESGEKIAAVCKGEKITYKELNEKANQLAYKLREKGIGPSKIVGIMVNRSIDMLISMLGVLKAGGCYLPIDSKFPQARIDYMLEDSKTALLITHAELDDKVNADTEILHLDPLVYQGNTENPEVKNSSMDPAYVIYTSGSTGKPKGVVLPHKAVHNFINGITDIIDFDSNKTIVSLTTISFDIFVLESLLPLSKGLRIIIADPMTFANDMGNEYADMVQTTPSTMKLILSDEKNLSYVEKFTDIMLGGEPFPKRLLDELQKSYDAKIYNMYGPTETTVWSMVKDLTKSNEITVGYPIANTQIVLVDENYQPVPYGEEGEICIAGDGVALGYLFREELTAQRFIPDIFCEGKKMYRTGDLGKYHADGDLECLGRIDSQVKIRGFRIELEEIENVLLKLDGIDECVVSTKKNRNDEKYLVGYYVSKKDLTITDIIGFLKESLPDYMIPGSYLRIDEIPLTPNGKVNHLALPEIEMKRPLLRNEYVEPETELEKKIASIWLDVLNIDKVGVLDNFLDLGGNSIHISAVYAFLTQLYPNKLSIADLFTYPTIRDLCSYLLSEDFKTNTIMLKSEFYHEDGTAEEKIHLSYDISTTEHPYLNVAVFAYLLADKAMSSSLTIYYKKDEKYKEIVQDFTQMDDLEEIINTIAASSQTSKELDEKELALGNQMNKNGLLITFTEQEDTIREDILENEIAFSIEKGETSKMHLYFYDGILDKEQMNYFGKQYIELLSAVLDEL